MCLSQKRPQITAQKDNCYCMDRFSIIRELLIEHDAEAALLTFMPDIRWCTGFTGSNALVVCTQDEAHFITDGRYSTQSKEEVHGAHIHIASQSLIRCMAENRLGTSARRILVQADHLTLSEFERLKDVLPGTVWLPVTALMQKHVAIKTKEEKQHILQAQNITDEVFSYMRTMLLPGLTEQEIAAEIVYQHMKRGAASMSFDPIVASGPNSALPHARPTDRALQHGDLVVIDMGCIVNGYASDMTRTLAIGEADEQARDVYNIVLNAQEKALQAASAQLSSLELDRVARGFIEEAGYGDYFTHSLGHGVGLQIHEWPSISWRSDFPLASGMIITIEPGVYVPEKLGVRIEDMIYLEDDGCENLTGSTKELIVI